MLKWAVWDHKSLVLIADRSLNQVVFIVDPYCLISLYNIGFVLYWLQRMYVELDEPDGVQGVAAMRRAPPSLHEQILTYSGRQGN